MRHAPDQIALEIVTPDRSLVTRQVDELQLPGSEGYFGVLARAHADAGDAQVGEMWYRIGQEMHYLAIAFGFVEVLPERVTVLAQIAERARGDRRRPRRGGQARAEERVAQPVAGLRFRASPDRADEVADPSAGRLAGARTRAE